MNYENGELILLTLWERFDDFYFYLKILFFFLPRQLGESPIYHLTMSKITFSWSFFHVRSFGCLECAAWEFDATKTWIETCLMSFESETEINWLLTRFFLWKEVIFIKNCDQFNVAVLKGASAFKMFPAI